MSGLTPVPDPYRVLGVPRGASVAQIKAAHRGLAKRFHPDAPGGDRDRFLAIQAAYLLLADPVRRRDWDARHAPGPVRAGEGTTRGRRPASGHWTREEPEAGSRRTARPAREAAPRSRTWSAEGVPWWEESPAGRAARAARGRRPQSQAAGPSGDVPPAASAPAEETSSGPPPPNVSPPGNPPSGAPSAFDVYSRSSGAAWSSAARRYFRAADSDLPSRGAFMRQGTQYVTGARAREAATQSIIRPAQAGAPPRQAFHHDAPAPTPRPQQSSPASRPAGAQAANLRAAERPLPRVVARRHRSAGADLPKALAKATLAWLPLAGLVAYGLPLSAGCGPTDGSCPDALGPLQAGVAVALLLAFLVFPRLASIGATATAAGLLVAVPLGLAGILLGLFPPGPQIAAVGLAAVGLGYIIGGCVAAKVDLRPSA